jgi:hypothetical protein
MGKELWLMDLYCVCDDRGLIAACEDEVDAQRVADTYWCWYEITKTTTPDEQALPNVKTMRKQGEDWVPLR